MHIYFSGIGGVAIGPLALICRDAGYEVSGSDLKSSLMTQALQKAGVAFAIGQDGAYISEIHAQQPIDWLVVSSALPSDHPEILFAKKQSIRISKRSEMLNFLLEEKSLKLIAIAGTHGKTTTTAMVVWLFKQFNIPISYSIGTNLNFGPSGAYQSSSEYFVYECDEYDHNMLSFHPYLSIITSIGYDHPDTYATPAEYDEAFRQFIGQSTTVITWHNDYSRLDLKHAELLTLDKNSPDIPKMKLAGLHNRQNAWQAVTAFLQLFPEFSLTEVIAKINTFPGTSRRFEQLAEGVYSDYAHHPSEIRATLQLASERNPQVIVVYQPHQNSRQHHLADQYRDCFNEAAHVYWLPTYLSREDPALPTLTPSQLIAHLANPTTVEPAAMDQTLIHKLQEHRKNGALILFMGAGSIDEWARQHFIEK